MAVKPQPHVRAAANDLDLGRIEPVDSEGFDDSLLSTEASSEVLFWVELRGAEGGLGLREDLAQFTKLAQSVLEPFWLDQIHSNEGCLHASHPNASASLQPSVAVVGYSRYAVG